MRSADERVPRGVQRRAFLLTMAAIGCAKPPAGGGPRPRTYEALLSSIRARRRTLARDPSTSDEAARAALYTTIVDELFPAWLGTRWSFHGTATRPHAPEGIACGYFVATILEAAGVRLASRPRFGRATARAIARALAPTPSAHHRILSVPAYELERRLRALGDGLYLIGLNVHVGFVVVRGPVIRFVHASYTGAQQVTDEPLNGAVAIESSRAAGYFVTSLLDDLAPVWLRGTEVPPPG